MTEPEPVACNQYLVLGDRIMPDGAVRVNTVGADVSKSVLIVPTVLRTLPGAVELSLRRSTVRVPGVPFPLRRSCTFPNMTEAEPVEKELPSGPNQKGSSPYAVEKVASRLS